ncbi:PAS domain-containing sensor histidine kinase [Rufibacter sp. XAAS-G3-1]|uniref:PAS domain-containing sensor histidine kinase n=1 Tax=Rufibacter sp. XAAS-G3-1 TaxID=2729134 RepID=UPI0015E71867|nr:PAS domain-containing sensor histidine kinase [Rufibacter sp. XAAS-G3-1]
MNQTRAVKVTEPTAPHVNFELMHALADHCNEPMLLVQSNGKIVYVNQALCQLVGQSEAYILQTGRNVLRDLEDDRWAVALKTRSETGHHKGEVNLMHRSGTRIPVEVSSRSFSASDGTTFASVHVRDLRAEKEAKQQLEKQQQELEIAVRDLQLLLDSTADLICTFSPDGRLLQVNQACQSLLGYTPAEMVGRNYRAFIHPEDMATTEADTSEVLLKESTLNFKNRYFHKNGSIVYFSWSTSHIRETNKMYCIARDISKDVLLEAKDREKEYRLQTLLQEGQDIVCIIDRKGIYSFVSGSIRHVLGFEPNDLVGSTAFDFIHPEDIPDVLSAFGMVLAGENVKTQPFRFKSKTGEWRWLETRGVNCFHHPAINGIIINSRDITDRLEAQKQLERSEKMYKALFENNPDSVYSINKEGFFTSVNAATIASSGYTQQELLQMKFTQLLHPDWVSTTNDYFMKSLAGEPSTSETQVITKQGEKRHVAITKVPVIANGELVGLHGIAKDITESRKQQQLLKNTANRLNSILESIKDAFFTLDKNWCFTYVNHEFEKYMAVKSHELSGLDIRTVYPRHQFGQFYPKLEKAIALQLPVHFEVYSDLLHKWLELSAYPSEEGLSVFIKGIDARKKVEAELNKLSLVASKTVNSVYITDEEARIEWVNDGFTRVTGYTLKEVIGRKPGDLLAGPDTNPDRVSLVRQKLVYDKPFVQEVQNRSKAGEVYWSKLDVTPIIDELNGGGKKFIVIETDITEQKKAEQERATLTEELLRRNRHLEQYTYIVSHNLRSPVANILGLTSLLHTANNKDLQDGITTRLQQTAQNLDNIIKDLNEMLSLQAGVLADREKILLPEIIEQALQVLPADSFHKVTLALNGIQEIGSIRSYVSSIISNLLTNAVKYKSPDRPLCLTIKAELQEQKEMLCLSVSDNGLGINLEKEGKNIFGLYKRFHFHVSGRGLGLYLVKTQAEALGGQVAVESKLNEGSTFRVYIKNYH